MSDANGICKQYKFISPYIILRLLVLPQKPICTFAFAGKQLYLKLVKKTFICHANEVLTSFVHTL